MNSKGPATKPARWSLWKSFGFAIRGVGMLLRTQANARIHAVATVVVVTAGFLFDLTRGEWCAVVGAIGLVVTAEGLNTAIEVVVDLVSPQYHELARQAKDVAAGAVLCAAIAAAVLGGLAFWPHIAAHFGAR